MLGATMRPLLVSSDHFGDHNDNWGDDHSDGQGDVGDQWIFHIGKNIVTFFSPGGLRPTQRVSDLQ